MARLPHQHRHIPSDQAHECSDAQRVRNRQGRGPGRRRHCGCARPHAQTVLGLLIWRNPVSIRGLIGAFVTIAVVRWGRACCDAACRVVAGTAIFDISVRMLGDLSAVAAARCRESTEAEAVMSNTCFVQPESNIVKGEAHGDVYIGRTRTTSSNAVIQSIDLLLIKWEKSQ